MLELGSSNNLFPYIESNPYKELLAKGEALKKLISTDTVPETEDMNLQKAEQLIKQLSNDIKQLRNSKKELEKKRDSIQSDYDKISPFVGLKYDIKSILLLNILNSVLDVFR